MSKSTVSQYPSALTPTYPNYSPTSSDIQTPISPPLDSQQASPSSPLGYWGVSNPSRPPKQIRSPRAPLYVPAVLRPTVNPTKPSQPSTRRVKTLHTAVPASEHGSDDSLHSIVPTLRRMVTEEWFDDAQSKIAGPPSRNHWKPDPSTSACDSPTCERTFTLLIRRHHCRRCGSIFCAEHSPHSIPLDHHARFHLQAQKYRACDDCFRDYKIWEAERLRKLGASAAIANDTHTNSINPSIGIVAKNLDTDANKVPLAQSIPSNWTWSTF